MFVSIKIAILYWLVHWFRIQSTCSNAPLNRYVVLSCGWSSDLDRCKVNGFYSQAFSIRVRKNISSVGADTGLIGSNSCSVASSGADASMGVMLIHMYIYVQLPRISVVSFWRTLYRWRWSFWLSSYGNECYKVKESRGELKLVSI